MKIKIEADVEALYKKAGNRIVKVGVFKIEQKRKWIYVWIEGRKTPIKIRNEGENRERIDSGDYKYFLNKIAQMYKKGEIEKADEEFLRKIKEAKQLLEKGKGGWVVVKRGNRYMRGSQTDPLRKKVAGSKGYITNDDVVEFAENLYHEEKYYRKLAEQQEREIKKLKEKAKKILEYIKKHRDVVKKVDAGQKLNKRERQIWESIKKKYKEYEQIVEELGGNIE